MSRYRISSASGVQYTDYTFDTGQKRPTGILYELIVVKVAASVHYCRSHTESSITSTPAGSTDGPPR